MDVLPVILYLRDTVSTVMIVIGYKLTFWSLWLNKCFVYRNWIHAICWLNWIFAEGYSLISGIVNKICKLD